MLKLKKLKALLILGYICFPLYAQAESVSPKPYILFSIGDFFPVTNSILTSWVFSLITIFFVRWAVGKPKLIPQRGQLIVEETLQGIFNLIEPITGKSLAKPLFPWLMGFFTYILFQNWSGLLPGVGTFGLKEGNHLLYFFRPGNADLNATLALAIVAFFLWIGFILKSVGFLPFLHHTFGNKANRNEMPLMIYFPLFLLFFGVGLIECVSIMFRVVSLSFRLFGNIFGGESLLTSIQGFFRWILPVPFYFLEALVGLIQAFVFTLLVAVYIGLACNTEE